MKILEWTGIGLLGVGVLVVLLFLIVAIFLARERNQGRNPFR